jgi:hypothetical protein
MRVSLLTILASVCFLASCGKQSGVSSRATDTTRHPDTDAPELAPYFTGERYYYLGEFFQNYAYLLKLEGGTYLDKLADGGCAADVHTAREAAAVVFYNPKARAFATVDMQDPKFENMKIESLQFAAASPDSLVGKAWARASNPDAYKQDHKQGKRALWVYVDTHADERRSDTYYAETAIHTEPKAGYKFFELIAVTHERFYFTIDGKARKFRADLTDLLGTPVGDKKERDMKDGDIASAIWRLYETRVIE